MFFALLGPYIKKKQAQYKNKQKETSKIIWLLWGTEEENEQNLATIDILTSRILKTKYIEYIN